jgi:type I restriction enzyme S subunit
MGSLGGIYGFKGTNSLPRKKLNDEHGLAKNIHYGDIHTKYPTLFDITREEVPYINPEESLDSVNSETYCREGDIILADASEDIDDIGKTIELCHLNGEKVLAGLHTLLARQRDRKFVTGFAGYLFKCNFVRTEIKKEAQGAKVLGISATRLANIRLFFPECRAEQQKIADCLSSLDELIAAHTDKLNALKTHKKGLLQQLFPQDGDIVSRLRFPAFRDGGEWAYRTLEEFISERSESPDADVPLYSLTIENGVAPKTERYERSFLVKDESEAYKLVRHNDFAYNPMNLRFGAIARYRGKTDVAVSKYYNIFYCDNSVNSKFCEIFFKTPGMISHYDNVATGSLIEKRRVHFDEFLKFYVRFPSLREQQEIADCLTSLDDRIAAQADKIEALKQHKKGLLQQLFPAMDGAAA